MFDRYGPGVGRRGRDYSWLPEHHLGVAATLSHVDELVSRAGEALYGYLKPPGPLELATVADGPLAHVTVAGVAPLPTAAARYAADALTQLRAAIEHSMYAEVEHQLARPLTAREARSIEMPACASEADFSTWLRHGSRKGLAPLREGAPLVQRMRDLQPYHRRDHDNHPLRVLAEHTNLAKHRTPAVAATLLGLVKLDEDHPDVHVAAANSSSEEDRPVRAGDVLVSGPRFVQVPVSIWPKVCIQRPHTGTWHVFMHELGELEAWVRRIAVPMLIIGTHDVDPLPPQFDTTVGHHDVRAALASAGTVPANARATKRIEAGTVRIALVEFCEPYADGVDVARLRAWVDTLDDEAVLARHDQLVAARFDARALGSVLRQWLAEAAAVDPEQDP